jgi:hypothetical protein
MTLMEIKCKSKSLSKTNDCLLIKWKVTKYLKEAGNERDMRDRLKWVMLSKIKTKRKERGCKLLRVK